MREHIQTTIDRIVRVWIDYDSENAAPRRDRDYLLLCRLCAASFVILLALRWFTHLEFLSGIAFGAAIAIASVAGLARGLRRTNATMKVETIR